jgi:hypothetical protein
MRLLCQLFGRSKAEPRLKYETDCERYLELAPKYWAATRARLDPKELDAEIGPITVPPQH